MFYQAGIKIVEIERNKVVAFSYVLKGETGEEIERSDANSPMVYLHGHGNILPGLESALKGCLQEDITTVTLPAERAYGLRKEGSHQRVPIKHIINKPKKLVRGMTVKINTADGAKDVLILKVGKFNVDIDSNHPLAGLALTFDIKIEGIRDATMDELAHGHSHGFDGASGH
jgi:FKBP-type peptidyl-prolyl cis-trans isomerase SlyD|tara:strand:+ start:112 stop:627 length:516 start_codon:yes stop_codon:yes gene_type:complete